MPPGEALGNCSSSDRVRARSFFLASLNACYVRQLDSGGAIMSLLGAVQETLLDDDSHGLRFSGISIAAERTGYRSLLPDDFDSEAHSPK